MKKLDLRLRLARDLTESNCQFFGRNPTLLSQLEDLLEIAVEKLFHTAGSGDVLETITQSCLAVGIVEVMRRLEEERKATDNHREGQT